MSSELDEGAVVGSWARRGACNEADSMRASIGGVQAMQCCRREPTGAEKDVNAACVKAHLVPTPDSKYGKSIMM